MTVIISGCKSRSVSYSENTGSAGEETSQTVGSSISDNVTESDISSEAETVPVSFQGYMIGNKDTIVALEVPEALDFSEEYAEIGVYDFYGNNDEYTVALMWLEYKYTLGQPQELLDHLGALYEGIEFISETTDDGKAFDMVMVELYPEKGQQDNTGVCGIYPIKDGVIFFGYEMYMQKHYNTAVDSLKSVRIFENESAQISTEIVNNSEISPDFSVTLPYELEIEYPEQQYLEAGDNPDYCTILFAENEDITISAHGWRGEKAWQYALDSMSAVADDDPDIFGEITNYKLNDNTYISLQHENGSPIFASGYYKVSDTEFIMIAINLPYNFDLEESCIFSLVGLKLSENYTTD